MRYMEIESAIERCKVKIGTELVREALVLEKPLSSVSGELGIVLRDLIGWRLKKIDPENELGSDLYISTILKFEDRDMTLDKFFSWAWSNDAHESFSPNELDNLEVAAKKKGLNPLQFLHNCTEIKPWTHGEQFRGAFRNGVSQATTIQELLSVNTSEFRNIKGLEGMIHDLRHFVAWFGLKNFRKFQRLFVRKLKSLAKSTKARDLLDVVTFYSKMSRNELSSWVKWNNQWEDGYDETKPSPRETRADELGISTRPILGMDRKVMAEIAKICLENVTSFLDCYEMYSRIHSGKIGSLILDRLLQLASNVEEHWKVSVILSGKSLAKRKNQWKKHVLYMANLLKKKR